MVSLLAVETQGSRWQNWLKDIDQVTLSPKPPSSKMEVNFETLDFIVSQLDPDKVTFKIPVFDDNDLAFAKGIQERYQPDVLFLSVGNLSPRLQVILSKTNWTVSKNSGNASLLTIAGAMSASFLNSILSSTTTNVVFKIRKKNHVTTRRNEKP